VTTPPPDPGGSGNVVPGPGYRPARGYSWEPFKPGNTKAMTHGARSERCITPLAAEIANQLMQEHPRLRDPAFRGPVLEYSRLQAQVELLEKWTDDHGLIDEETGDVRNAAQFLLKVRKQAMNVADRLGLTPLAAARLGRDNAAAAVDVTAILAQIKENPSDAS
jgi:hypothetical protein